VAQPTIEDVSSVASPEISSPAIVMIASGTTPHALGFAPVGVVQLGRHITSGDFTAEIDDERVSREHATVEWQAGGWRIVDLDSRNGTFVDGVRLAGELYRAGDLVLRLGHTVFVLVRDGRGHLAPRDDGAMVIGPELSRAYDAIRRHATDRASDTLLVHGESGSGKELAARLYHDTRTPTGPFIAVNCATIPEGVAERLLFGSKRGAFSGAIDAVGYLQSAHGGTLFLDEIAELDPAVQAKLLRVLETRDVVPIGATSPVAVQIAVVAASHRELRAAMGDKQFRDDLYYRLARVVIHLPPLRARKIDAARLAVRELAAVDRRLSAHAKLIEACCIRAWPGNVRELRGAVGQAAREALAGGRDVVRVTDLPPHAGLVAGAAEPQTADPPAPTLDKASVLAAIASADGVLSVAARALGVHRTQLYRLMEKLGISREK
jgi:DNA-binding NtrC family response regulator